MQSTSLAWSTQTCLAVNTCTLGDIYIFMLMQRESQSAGLPKGVSRDETLLILILKIVQDHSLPSQHLRTFRVNILNIKQAQSSSVMFGVKSKS